MWLAAEGHPCVCRRSCCSSHNSVCLSGTDADVPMVTAQTALLFSLVTVVKFWPEKE